MPACSIFYSTARHNDIRGTELSAKHRNISSNSIKIESITSPSIGAKAETSEYYFILEGQQTHGDIVKFGTDVNLIFDYEIPPTEALAWVSGEKLEKVRRSDADLGITVIPKGFAFREKERGPWHKVARFREGHLLQKVRFELRAIDAPLDLTGNDNTQATNSADIAAFPNKPVYGFYIAFDIRGHTLHEFFLSVRLVPSLMNIPSEALITHKALEIDLDKFLKRAKEAEETLAAVMTEQ